MLKVVPFACVWHLGLYRNEETLQPVTYYNKMREDQVANAGTVLVLDPMLATGGSVTAAIKALKDKGAKKIKVIFFFRDVIGKIYSFQTLGSFNYWSTRRSKKSSRRISRR